MNIGSKSFLQVLAAVAEWCLLRVIDAYAVTFGGHFGGRCRFEPSCSAYSRQAIREHGPIAGARLAASRILRCGPWHVGGHDPVPPRI